MSSPENVTDSSSSSLLDNEEDNVINNNNKHFVLPTELYKNLLANAVLGKAETMHFSSPGQSNLASVPAFPRNLLFSSTTESTDEVVYLLSSFSFYLAIRGVRSTSGRTSDGHRVIFSKSISPVRSRKAMMGMACSIHGSDK